MQSSPDLQIIFSTEGEIGHPVADLWFKRQIICRLRADSDNNINVHFFYDHFTTVSIRMEMLVGEFSRELLRAEGELKEWIAKLKESAS